VIPPGRIRIVSSLLASAILSLAGCGPARDATAPSPPFAYVVARDGGFSYRVPRGWFDASADSQARDHVALLVRNDYRASIAVDQVHLDDAARSELRRGGLVPVARLLVSLSSWDGDALLTVAPHAIALAGKEACRYALASGNGEDAIEVTLVENRERLYAVRVLVSGRGKEESLHAAQEEFLETVRW
jgi:hypothetical protein